MKTALIPVALGLALLGARPAAAETSPITDAFVAATVPAYTALQRADALALAEGANARLTTFARRDSASQAEAVAALVAWGQAQQRADYAAAQTPSLDGLGPLLYPFNTTVIPFGVPGRTGGESYAAPLAQLGTLHGAAFEALYVTRQSAILRRLVAVYTDYIKNGDDPRLRLLSVRNLPKLQRLLAELDRT